MANCSRVPGKVLPTLVGTSYSEPLNKGVNTVKFGQQSDILWMAGCRAILITKTKTKMIAIPLLKLELSNAKLK